MKALLRNVRESKNAAKERVKEKERALEKQNSESKDLGFLRRDRANTKDSKGAFYDEFGDLIDFDKLDPETVKKMDPLRARQLQIVTQIRRLVRSGEDFTWLELLEHLGITELEYLEYGAIWRDIGSADKSASLRQKDQFIYLDDLRDLCEKAQHIFKIPNLGEDKISKLDIPVMGFHFGDKVHRLDVTKALLTEAIEQILEHGISENEKRKIQVQVEEHLKKRYPTRELMAEYEIYSTNSILEFSAQKIN